MQAPIQVLRIQNRRGEGIFRNGWSINNCPSISARHQKFNTPWEDGLDIYRGDYQWFCAYKSIEQIQQWIMPEEFEMLVEGGFKIYIFTITEYQMGNDQVLFTKESIKSRKNVTELFKLSQNV